MAFALLVALLVAGLSLSSAHAAPIDNVAAQGAGAAIDAATINSTVKRDIARLGAPSASVAVVADGRIVYAGAAGEASLDPARAATPTARYGVGSISKEFLAAGILLLQQDGKLSLDDRAGKYIADLGPASDVTIRQLLSHTSGVRDYWPQDYVFTQMLSPITADRIVSQWARQPLDFAPGERWQYSNTGYVSAGMILEKVSGQPVFSFLKDRIFQPLKMTSVVNFDEGGLGSSDAAGYTRYALGPWHPAPSAGKGWAFAAGELAMTAEDLARWDLSIINRTLLKPESYRELETEILLNNGAGTGYALGLDVSLSNERRVLAHGGEVSGFLSQNTIFPDQRAAVVVLTNTDASTAVGTIADDLKDLVLGSVSPVDRERANQMRDIFDHLRNGQIDRALLSANANAYFTDAAVREIAASLAPLGAVKTFKLVNSGTRGGMDFHVYDVALEKGRLELVTRALPNGKLEQFMAMPK
ncbi:MAG TPA: serine hydrolase domain-containing protein [Rhizomicrobium sp.]|nr:serine hydrolase domain-containing protein [Rhizomicrobium sp.]